MRDLNTYPYRIKAVFRTVLFLFLLTTVTRLGLMIYSWSSIDLNISLPAAWLIGFFFDVLNLSYFGIVYYFLLCLVPNWLFKRKFGWIVPLIIGIPFVFIGYFTLTSEFVFWHEFGVRFNFIAVDYLVYTNEVLRNIQESYPMPLIFWGLILVTVITLIILGRKLKSNHEHLHLQRPVRRFIVFFLVVGFIGLAEWLVDQDDIPFFVNNYHRELAKNGTYSLFAAFWKNELDYEEFYRTLPSEKLDTAVRKEMGRGAGEFVSENLEDWQRTFTYPGEEKRWNVVQITVESLSAEYLSHWGCTENLTPHLDALIDQGYAMGNLYATGTRTVRGLEALTTLLPPTPGRSSVKRDYGNKIDTVAKEFRQRGYSLSFLYGGNGYFDNMNYYFSGHGFKIIDEPTKSSEDITFQNAWGVCDEDLLSWALDEADEAYRERKPFYQFIMTTSNHRPFTYPQGKVSIPSGTGRYGAVAYTDYAIGAFIEKAKNREWFNNTIFLIVADHCAESAMKADLDVSQYQIPAIFYAPGLIEKGWEERLASQIDVIPTLLGKMGWTYSGTWFGQDVATVEPGNGRAYIGNYQKLGRLADDTLVVLGPKKETHTYHWNSENGNLTKVENAAEVEATIGAYQGANEILKPYKDVK